MAVLGGLAGLQLTQRNQHSMATAQKADRDVPATWQSATACSGAWSDA